MFKAAENKEGEGAPASSVSERGNDAQKWRLR